MANFNVGNTSGDSAEQSESSEADSMSATSVSKRMIKLGMSIDDGDCDESEYPPDMPPLEGDLEKDSDMEEVD